MTATHVPSVPAYPMADRAPMVSVLWRGHRIEVHGDQRLVGGRNRQHIDAVGSIALAIQSATSLEGIREALDACPLGQTHDVSVQLIEGRIRVLLLAR